MAKRKSIKNMKAPTHRAERMVSRTVEGKETWVPIKGSEGSEDFTTGWLTAFQMTELPGMQHLTRLAGITEPESEAKA